LFAWQNFVGILFLDIQFINLLYQSVVLVFHCVCVCECVEVLCCCVVF
jgi:hypothetical protein